MTFANRNASDNEPGSVSPAVHRLQRLAELSPGELAQLAALTVVERTGAGRTIRSVADPNPRPRFVTSGWAARQKLLHDGRRQILNVILPGDLIGVGDYDASWSMTSIVALTQVETVDASSIIGPAGEAATPGLAAAMAAHLQLEHWFAVEQIVRLGRRAALERAAHFLLELEYRLAMAGQGDRGRFALPITQEAMSDVLGLSIVHINRTFLQLRRERWIDIRSRVVELIKLDQLKAAADFQPPPMLARRAPGGPEALRASVAV